MEVRAESAKFYDVEADALVVTIYEGEKATDGALKELDERTGGILSEMLGSDEMRGKQGDMVFVHRPGNLRAGRLLLVGAGKREEFSLDTIRKVAGSAARFLRGKGMRSMAVLRRSQLDLGKSAQAAVEGILLGLFEPDMYKTEHKEERRIDELVLLSAATGSEGELASGVERGRIIGEAVNLACLDSLFQQPFNFRQQRLFLPRPMVSHLVGPQGLARLVERLLQEAGSLVFRAGGGGGRGAQGRRHAWKDGPKGGRKRRFSIYPPV